MLCCLPIQYEIAYGKWNIISLFGRRNTFKVTCEKLSDVDIAYIADLYQRENPIFLGGVSLKALFDYPDNFIFQFGSNALEEIEDNFIKRTVSLEMTEEEDEKIREREKNNIDLRIPKLLNTLLWIYNESKHYQTNVHKDFPVNKA
jgi:predicted nucleotidyltransferase